MAIILSGMILLRFFLIAAIFSFTISAFADDAPGSGGQLGELISWIDVPDSDGLVHAVQFSHDGKLFLTANESFFPKLGLTASGMGTVADVANLNGGKSFATIEKWDAGDSAEWGIWITKPGDLNLQIHMSDESKAGKFSITHGEQSEDLSLRNGVASITFKITKPGRHSVVLTCREGSGRGAALNWIEVSGPAAEKSGVIRKRWRPAAAHTKFTSSKVPDNIRLWIMEMDAVPGDLGFYSPITTPFGYYGPVWNKDGTVGTSFNFSLWSFGRGKSEPPLEQLSHLLAIGNPKAKFSGFDHEGTGVKIRDWEPLKGRQGQRQALALRVESGKKYDTYFSYFYATDEKRWRLFGVGNKYNKGKPLSSLWVGSFVEVPGPPPVQRSGAWERRMLYRGWVMNDKGRLYPLDRMARGNVSKETGLTHTDRGVTNDGWFYLETGGWNFRKIRDEGDVGLPPGPDKVKVDYLDPDDIEFLTTVPCDIAVTKLERAKDQARLTVSIKNAGADAVVAVYWGSEEGLTLAERWANRTEVSETVKEGENQFILKNVPAGKPLFVRALLQNAEGQFWSRETVSK